MKPNIGLSVYITTNVWPNGNLSQCGTTVSLSEEFSFHPSQLWRKNKIQKIVTNNFYQFREANHHFAKRIIISAKRNYHFRPSGGISPTPPRKLNIPYGGAVRLRRSLTEPFEPDTGNTGEGSLKSTDSYRGCRTFTAGMCGSFVFRENWSLFRKKSEKIGD